MYLTGSNSGHIPLCPNHLKPPEAIRSSNYYKAMKQVRIYQQMGVDKASKFCLEVVDPESRPLEEKIAFLLESCVSHIVGDELKLVEDIIKQAEDMCTECSDLDCLRARCGWVKAWLCKRKRDYFKAVEHINISLGLIFHYVSNTEEAILLNYCHGCILLETASDKEKAKQAFGFSL